MARADSYPRKDRTDHPQPRWAPLSLNIRTARTSQLHTLLCGMTEHLVLRSVTQVPPSFRYETGAAGVAGDGVL